MFWGNRSYAKWQSHREWDSITWFPVGAVNDKWPSCRSTGYSLRRFGSRYACLDVLGPRAKLPWYFSFGRRSSVMFLLSKRTMAGLIERRIERGGSYRRICLMENTLLPVSLTSVFEKRIGRSSTTIVFSFNWNPQIKIGYVPRVIIFRRYIVFS